jgi:hypothetical protein
MSPQRSSTDLVVAPAQVWAGLTSEAQAAAIQLLARLASDLLAQQPDPNRPEISPCFRRPAPPRFAPSISTAKP